MYQNSKPLGMQTLLNAVAGDTCLVFLVAAASILITIVTALLTEKVSKIVADCLAITCHVTITASLASILSLSLTRSVLILRSQWLDEISDSKAIKWIRRIVLASLIIALAMDHVTGSEQIIFMEILLKEENVKR